jgi:hypothetical protein
MSLSQCRHDGPLRNGAAKLSEAVPGLQKSGGFVGISQQMVGKKCETKFLESAKIALPEL